MNDADKLPRFNLRNRQHVLSINFRGTKHVCIERKMFRRVDAHLNGKRAVFSWPWEISGRENELIKPVHEILLRRNTAVNRQFAAGVKN